MTKVSFTKVSRLGMTVWGFSRLEALITLPSGVKVLNPDVRLLRVFATA